MAIILDKIGNSPLVRIKKLNPGPGVKIYAKLEGFNPTGSIKDRVALALIESAEKAGALAKDKTVVEASGGNTGIGVAMVAAAKGYKAIIVAPETISADHRRIIAGFGAQLILVKPEICRQGAIEMIGKMAVEDGNLVVLDKFSNPENCAPYFGAAGKEIVGQVPQKIDYFIACVGTGSTISGIARQLRQTYPDIKIIGIQPRIWTNRPVTTLASMPNPPRDDQSKNLIDAIVEIDENEARNMVRQLESEEGISAGLGSGAAMAVARRYAQKKFDGTIVAIFPYRGERYLSTEIFKN
jgi:cysteinyl-tRNA synthetase